MLNLRVVSTDLDVLERFTRIMGFKAIYSQRPRFEHNKTLYCSDLSQFEQVERALVLMLPYLGARRANRAREALLYISERHPEIVCPCGTVFRRKRKNNRFCSRKCKENRSLHYNGG